MVKHSTVTQSSQDSVSVATTSQAIIHSSRCHRCGNLMIADYCLDVASDSGEVIINALKCFACGEVVDPTILRNRNKNIRISKQQTSQPRFLPRESLRFTQHQNTPREVLGT